MACVLQEGGERPPIPRSPRAPRSHTAMQAHIQWLGPMGWSLLLGSAAVVTTTWRACELRDPALMPRSGGAPAYGLPWAAAAYAHWPAPASLCAKAAYFVRHAPLLIVHATVYHWAECDLGVLAFPLAALALARLLRLRWKRRAQAALCAWAVAVLLHTAALAACAAPGDLGGAALRTSVAHCPPPLRTTIGAQALEALLPLRIALLLSSLLLPAAQQLAIGLVWWCGIGGHLLLIHARYGYTGGPAAACRHQAHALTWRTLGAALAAPGMVRVLATSLAAVTLIPLAVSHARAALQRRLRAAAAGAQCSSPGWWRARKRSSPAEPQPPQPGTGPSPAARAAAAALAGAAVPPACASPAQTAVALRLQSRRASAADWTAGGGGRDGDVARARARARVSLYRSSRPAGATLVLKLSTADDTPASHARLEEQMPGILAQALAVAGGTAAGTAAEPRVLSAVGFRGCFAMVADVAPLPANAAAVVEMLLPALLPDDVDLLGVGQSPLPAHVDALPAGAWLEVPAAALGHVTTAVALPLSLLQELSDAECGLRVIVASATNAAPVVDATLHAHEPGWPHTGRLQLALPPLDAPTLVLVTLLRTPPRAAAGAAPMHGADAFLASLPLLVLPDAAAEEVQLLWADLVDSHALDAPPGTPQWRAARAAAADFVPFVYDLGMLLAHGAVAPLHIVAAPVLDHLAANGLDECERLLRAALGNAYLKVTAPTSEHASSGAVPEASETELKPTAACATQCGSSAACGSRPSASAPPPPPQRERLSARALLWGCRSAAAEAAYQRWKASRLLVVDAWVIGFSWMRLMAIGLVFLRHAAHRAAGAAAVRLFVLQGLAIASPGFVYVLARRAYLGARGWWWVASVVALASVLAAAPSALAPADFEAFVGWFPRPVLFVLVMHLLYPAMMQLSLRQQALASAGELYVVHFFYRNTPGGGADLASAGYVLLPLCGMAIAGVLDWRLRRQWLASAAAEAAGGAAAEADKSVGRLAGRLCA